jgi:tetratricopeptide (TPR) repeat protein
MRYLAAAATIALTVLVAVLPAQENLGRARISGDVVDETGAGIPAVRLIAQFLQGSTKLEAKTDKKGHFALAGLGTGAWRVAASKDGYISAYEDVQVSQLKINPSITLKLKKAAGLEGLRTDDESRALIEKGNALLAEGKYDEALVAFEEFSAKFPEVYAIRLNVGTAYMKKGDLDRAEAEFRGVLEKSGGTGAEAVKDKDKETVLRALSGLGEIALKRGDLAAAQDHLRKSLEISPEDAAAAYNVAEIFFSNQNIDEAIAYFELAAKIRKDWAKPYQRLGMVYLNKGDFDKALENLRKFLELDPESPEAATVKATIAAVEKMKK